MPFRLVLNNPAAWKPRIRLSLKFIILQSARMNVQQIDVKQPAHFHHFVLKAATQHIKRKSLMVLADSFPLVPTNGMNETLSLRYWKRIAHAFGIPNRFDVYAVSSGIFFDHSRWRCNGIWRYSRDRVVMNNRAGTSGLFRAIV